MNVNNTNPYINSFNEKMTQAYEQITNSQSSNYNLQAEEIEGNKIHNEAVRVSISAESIKVYLNVKSAEVSKTNTGAQEVLHNIFNKENQNEQYLDFFSGKEMENGFSLESIGYKGKPLDELTKEEAKDLINEDNGFFGITQTSDRVSSFVFGLAKDDIEALEESRKGIVQGFEEAKKLFGGELPELSYRTQDRTLKLIDERIAELTGQKEQVK